MWSAACGPRDPWAGTPAPPEGPTRESWYRLDLHGRPIGVEQRLRGEEDPVLLRRRTWSLVLDGAPVQVRSVTRLELGSDHARSWTDASGRREGPAQVPDVLPPPGPGVWPVWNARGERVPTEIGLRDGVWSWSAGGEPARAAFDDRGLVWSEHAGLRVERVERPPEVAPVDVVALLSVPVPPQPAARGALVGRFRVDGAPVAVDAPTWAEVPRLPVADGPPEGTPEEVARAAAAVGDAPDRREAVRRLARAVSEALDGAATPGPPSAPAALATGRGDCDEHAEALVALARATGMRARTVAGLVYTDAPAPSFVPHAWAEVAFGDVWIPVDPALRQVPADAARIPLGADATDAAARVVAGVAVEVLALR